MTGQRRIDTIICMPCFCILNSGCPKCKRALGRDINSAVNIVKKAKLLSGLDYLAWDLD